METIVQRRGLFSPDLFHSLFSYSSRAINTKKAFSFCTINDNLLRFTFEVTGSEIRYIGLLSKALININLQASVNSKATVFSRGNSSGFDEHICHAVNHVDIVEKRKYIEGAAFIECMGNSSIRM